MSIVQKVVTDLTFHEGVLCPPGSTISIDTDKIELTDENSPNLAEVGSYPVLKAVAVAAISPTGPNPTAPQQIPPGVIQTVGGYVAPGSQLLVAEGSVLAAQADDVEEEASLTAMRGEAGDDATVAHTGGAPVAPLDAGLNADERAELEAFRAAKTQGEDGGSTGGNGATDGFNADGIIDGTIPDVLPRLEGLDADQLAAVRQAEEDREQSRVGILNAIDEAIAAKASA